MSIFHMNICLCLCFLYCLLSSKRNGKRKSSSTHSISLESVRFWLCDALPSHSNCVITIFSTNVRAKSKEERILLYWTCVFFVISNQNDWFSFLKRKHKHCSIDCLFKWLICDLTTWWSINNLQHFLFWILPFRFYALECVQHSMAIDAFGKSKSSIKITKWFVV